MDTSPHVPKAAAWSAHSSPHCRKQRQPKLAKAGPWMVQPTWKATAVGSSDGKEVENMEEKVQQYVACQHREVGACDFFSMAEGVEIGASEDESVSQEERVNVEKDEIQKESQCWLRGTKSLEDIVANTEL